MAGIMGRMAAESGSTSNGTRRSPRRSNGPRLDQYTMESHPPVMPDSQGRYLVAMPGTTKVL